MQKLILAALGAAVLGALSFAGKKLRARSKALPAEPDKPAQLDFNRWEGSGKSALSNPNLKG